jgi:Tol biopolymer transport system component
VALCASTGEPAISDGPRLIAATAVWTGAATGFRKLNAGAGACDPAWSPDGRKLAVTAAEGLWIFPAESSDGVLIVRSQVPPGGATEYAYRAFSHVKWSRDGVLVALVVSNGGTSWVEVYDPVTGSLFYTSPPETDSFSWGATARNLKVGTLDVQLPPYQRSGR